MTNSKLISTPSIFFLLLSINLGCSEQEVDNCVMGRITNDTQYQELYEGCFTNSIWIEVFNNDALGVDVTKPSFFPGGGGEPHKYKNVIEVPMPEEIRQNTRKDTLLGKEIYFNYRAAEENEKNALRNTECSEVYETLQVPVMVWTSFSFSNCPI